MHTPMARLGVETLTTCWLKLTVFVPSRAMPIKSPIFQVADAQGRSKTPSVTTSRREFVDVRTLPDVVSAENRVSIDTPRKIGAKSAWLSAVEPRSVRALARLASRLALSYQSRSPRLIAVETGKAAVMTLLSVRTWLMPMRASLLT